MNVVIVDAKRTPIGSLLGVYKDTPSTQLGACVIENLLNQGHVQASDIDQVIMGCVLPAGLGQSPARQAALFGKVDKSVDCITINKVCGSGLKAVMLAHDQIKAGTYTTIIAGGMENMSKAPYLLEKARDGYRYGHGRILDHMALDGLEDAYKANTPMGVYAEATAEKYGFTREAQDAFAINSVEKAQKAMKDGSFKNEIAPVSIIVKKEKIEIIEDEQPQKLKADKIPSLRPAFKADGTVTAASSSSISDGASALVITSEENAKNKGYPIRAKIVGHSTHSHEPEWFTTAPVGAMEKLLKKLNWTINDVDLFEINEAFAVVTMAAIKDLNIPVEKVNIHGGACALGHPIGASGSRVLTTLLHALEKNKLKRGIASLCIGGGEAVAIAIEIA